MQQFYFYQGRIPRWKIFLGAGLALALLLGLAVLALGVFLLALPAVMVAAALAYLFGGRGAKQPAPDGIIEAEYREIPPHELEQERK